LEFAMMESVMEVSSPRSYDASNRIAAAGVAYDAAGDMTRDGKHRYEFDAERRISQVDGGAAEYLYSAEGDRIEKRVGDASTETIWVGNDPMAELKPDGTWVDYLYLDGRRVAAIGKSDATYYVADPLGMTRMELSATGDTLAQSDMTPFGQLINRKSDADQVPFTGGEQYDAESGLYSYKYRSYNPQLGRWMSPDPSDEEFARVSNPQSLNLYSYVINDPLKYVDQLGLQAASSGGSCHPTQQQSPQVQSLVNAQNAAMANRADQPNTPTAGTTHCSEAACAIAKGTGTDLTGILYDSNGNNYDANTQIDNLANSSSYHVVTPDQAQALGDKGVLVFGTQHGARHGHIASVRPEGVPGDNPGGGSGPILANVGLFNGVAHQSAVMTPAHGAIVYYAPNQ
jgi:RHS repeat-associated protein